MKKLKSYLATIKINDGEHEYTERAIFSAYSLKDAEDIAQESIKRGDFDYGDDDETRKQLRSVCQISNAEQRTLTKFAIAFFSN